MKHSDKIRHYSHDFVKNFNQSTGSMLAFSLSVWVSRKTQTKKKKKKEKKRKKINTTYHTLCQVTALAFIIMDVDDVTKKKTNCLPVTQLAK